MTKIRIHFTKDEKILIANEFLEPGFESKFIAKKYTLHPHTLSKLEESTCCL
jgi:transposase-like protein